MSEESNYEFAAERVVLELLGRGGFDSWWYDIDRETREEIKSALAKTISNCFPPRELLADQPAATEAVRYEVVPLAEAERRLDEQLARLSAATETAARGTPEPSQGSKP